MIFILTFSLVSVSGYRVDELFQLAQTRLSTIAIGTTICILTSMLVFPVWAGKELHLLITRNMEKLADSLDGCTAKFFDENGDMNKSDEDCGEKLNGYICVLNSKATEEAMANFARWEPAHGRFNFRHPWKQYLKIGAAMRDCACCVESLHSCINSEMEVPKFLKKNLSDVCKSLSCHCSKVLKESAATIKTMTRPSNTDFSVREMNFAAEELRNALKSLPNPLLLLPSSPPPGDAKVEEPTTNPSAVPLLQILPLATAISLLTEISARIERISNDVDELASLAEFNTASDEKSQKKQPNSVDKGEDETMKTLQED
ncbi:hypothetical protein U1Q18_003476 [Sarracenia purpurea var. burkii]